MMTFIYFMGGVGTLITAVVSAFVLIKKYGPETTKIQVDSAQALVLMAETAARMSRTEADEVQRQMKELTAKVDHMEQELSSERREKRALARENQRLTERVEHLEKTLAELTGEDGLASGPHTP